MIFCFFFFKQKTAYEMRISDWSSDVCSSDLALAGEVAIARKNRYLVGAERLQRRLEKWSWVLQNRARLYSGASNALAVPVVNAITPARFYRDLYIGHRPAVIRGLVDHWPARSKWSLDAELGRAHV